MSAIYLPSKEDIKQMESYQNVNVYKYIVAKNVEKILSKDNYPVGIDPKLLEIEELVNSICYIYPQELSYFKAAQNNPWLCRQLLNKNSDNSVYELDTIANFSSIIQKDYGIVLYVIDALYENLSKNPEYRFKYKSNKAIDAVFLMYKTYLFRYPEVIREKLIEIEPAYFLVFPNNTQVKDNIRLATAIDRYTERYGVPYDLGREYLNTSIFDSKDKKVKTLVNNLYNKQ